MKQAFVQLCIKQGNRLYGKVDLSPHHTNSTQTDLSSCKHYVVKKTKKHTVHGHHLFIDF